jgi:hypothetical protein
MIFRFPENLCIETKAIEKKLGKICLFWDSIFSCDNPKMHCFNW